MLKSLLPLRYSVICLTNEPHVWLVPLRYSGICLTNEPHGWKDNLKIGPCQSVHWEDCLQDGGVLELMPDEMVTFAERCVFDHLLLKWLL